MFSLFNPCEKKPEITRSDSLC
uniref:Uncharacterized protein n=1 Tax=Arundo donax TaxID=35708 RepID=A0A0A9B639_ARUDO